MKCGSDPVLLWLWYRPMAVALIQPLVWELPYAADEALKSKNKQKNTFSLSKLPLPSSITIIHIITMIIITDSGR